MRARNVGSIHVAPTDGAVPADHRCRKRFRGRRRPLGLRGRAVAWRGSEEPRQHEQDGDDRGPAHAVATTPTRCTTLPRYPRGFHGCRNGWASPLSSTAWAQISW